MQGRNKRGKNLLKKSEIMGKISFKYFEMHNST